MKKRKKRFVFPKRNATIDRHKPGFYICLLKERKINQISFSILVWQQKISFSHCSVRCWRSILKRKSSANIVIIEWHKWHDAFMQRCTMWVFRNLIRFLCMTMTHLIEWKSVVKTKIIVFHPSQTVSNTSFLNSLIFSVLSLFIIHSIEIRWWKSFEFFLYLQHKHEDYIHILTFD